MNPTTPTPSLAEQARAINWFHRIRLDADFVTGGQDLSDEKCMRLNLPNNLRDKSVIDMGCWDGFFSFECERRGAARVVSTNDFVEPQPVFWNTRQAFHAFV
jgi:tRNA (mo5U34)-methyltransferase